MIKNIKVQNPNFSYRTGQEEAVAEVLEQMKLHKVVFLNAPTGSGKSLINLVSTNLGGSGYITTPLSNLVDQYKLDLDGKFLGLGATIMGRKNYPCPYLREKKLPNEEATADGAPCTEKDPFYLDEDQKLITNKDGEPIRICPKISKCPYYIARNTAMKSSVSVMTFHYLMIPVRYALLNNKTDDMDFQGDEFEDIERKNSDSTLQWRKRNILVVDEAHNLPDALVDFFSIDVNQNKWNRFKFNELFREITKLPEKLSVSELSVKSFELFQKYFQEYFEIETNRERLMSEELKNHSSSKIVFEGIEFSKYSDFQKELVKQRKLLNTLSFVKQRMEKDAEWIFSINTEKTKGELKWRPYEASTFMKNFWEKFENIIFSSATFLDYDLFMNRLQIVDYGVVEVESRFDPSKAPIKFPLNIKLNKRSLKENKEKDSKRIIETISKIANIHGQEKGVIHCHSYEYQKLIYDGLDLDLKKRMIQHNSRNRKDAIFEFKNSIEPKILLSVNMDQGTDFHDDLARWQVIVKMPFANLGDPWVSAHQKRLENWYSLDALQNIIQASGRIIRSESDYGTTYILDRNALDKIQQFTDKLPKWFLKRVVGLNN